MHKLVAGVVMGLMLPVGYTMAADEVDNTPMAVTASSPTPIVLPSTFRSSGQQNGGQGGLTLAPGIVLPFSLPSLGGVGGSGGGGIASPN
jgi:hypothetical protein